MTSECDIERRCGRRQELRVMLRFDTRIEVDYCRSGIGLSIVREYIEAHGGRIKLLDDAGLGVAATTPGPSGPPTPGAHFRITLAHEGPT